MEKEKARVKAAFLFPNGNVAVFGYDDQQIPDLQGPFEKRMYRRIRRYSDESTRWYGFFRGIESIFPRNSEINDSIPYFEPENKYQEGVNAGFIMGVRWLKNKLRKKSE